MLECVELEVEWDELCLLLFEHQLPFNRDGHNNKVITPDWVMIWVLRTKFGVPGGKI